MNNTINHLKFNYKKVILNIRLGKYLAYKMNITINLALYRVVNKYYYLNM